MAAKGLFARKGFDSESQGETDIYIYIGKIRHSGCFSSVVTMENVRNMQKKV